MNQIARIYVRFFKKYEFVHGTFAKFMMDEGLFSQYKRYWYPAGYWKYDDDRIEITSECAFVIITAIGVEEIGMELGEMDASLTLEAPFDLGKVVEHAKAKSKPSGVFIALFHKSDDVFIFDGEVDIERAGEILSQPKQSEK